MSAGVLMAPEAIAALRTLAEEHGVSAEEYLDALLNYAWSQQRRPGSWEAAGTFEYRNYDRRSREDGALSGCADRWWRAPK
jgi:hypothetical protein